jgi:hypothetical protein
VWAFIGAFTLSQSQIIVSFLLNLQNVLESAPSGYESPLMGLPGQFQEPAVRASLVGHIARFGGVLEGFSYSALKRLYGALNAWCEFASRNLVFSFDGAHIDVRPVVDPETVLPEVNPTRMLHIGLTFEPGGGNHHQAMEVGVCRAIVTLGYFRGAYPAQDRLKLVAILEPLESLVHVTQGVAQVCYIAVTDGESQEDPAGFRVSFNDSW